MPAAMPLALDFCCSLCVRPARSLPQRTRYRRVCLGAAWVHDGFFLGGIMNSPGSPRSRSVLLRSIALGRRTGRRRNPVVLWGQYARDGHLTALAANIGCNSTVRAKAAGRHCRVSIHYEILGERGHLVRLARAVGEPRGCAVARARKIAEADTESSLRPGKTGD